MKFSTLSFARLRVPVLSKAIILHFARRSMIFACLKIMPFFKAVARPIKFATGVARLKAHGNQAI